MIGAANSNDLPDPIIARRSFSDPNDIHTAAFGADSTELRTHFLRGPSRDIEQRLLKCERDSELEQRLILRATEALQQIFSKLSNLPPAITVYGSARIGEDDPMYELAVEVGRALAEEGFVVITGGGPSIMEGANKGAKLAGGLSVGLNILLEKEQGINPYVDIALEFDDLFTRKVGLRHFSFGFVGMPGGFGTLDELFEVLTLRQTKKMDDYPVVLIGKSHWEPLLDFLKNTLMGKGLISPQDLDNILVTDSPNEAARHLKKKAIEHFGVTEEIEMKKAA